MSRYTSDGIEMGYGLDDRSLIPRRGMDFFLHSVQTGTGTHSLLYMGYWGAFFRDKAAGA
jgi:hypothetical protein